MPRQNKRKKQKKRKGGTGEVPVTDYWRWKPESWVPGRKRDTETVRPEGETYENSF